MKVLLTGATGLLGEQVYKIMKSKGWHVIVLNRSIQGLVEEVIVNTDSPDFATKLFDLPRCDVVVHLASHIDFSDKAEDKDFFSATIFMTTILVSLAKLWNAHFILTSSISIYEDNKFITMDSNVNPKSAYARTKLLAENIVKSSGISKFSIYRYAGIFGVAQNICLGINKLIIEALTSKTIPKLHGNVHSKRNYLYAKDAALVILQSIEKKIYGTHLIAGEESLSIKEMADIISKVILKDNALLSDKITHEDQDIIVDKSLLFKPEYTFYSAIEDIYTNFEREI